VAIADPGTPHFLHHHKLIELTVLPESTIRKTVLRSLNGSFDRHLAQAENVRTLFIALNDEVFENRLAAVSLIGRLSGYNPAYVMPNLRKTLIQLLTELEYSNATYVLIHTLVTLVSQVVQTKS
jgi:phosphatidylinositol kinase/protein kinase (PI-3  family)